MNPMKGSRAAIELRSKHAGTAGRALRTPTLLGALALLGAACSGAPSADASLTLVVDGEVHQIGPVALVDVHRDGSVMFLFGLDASRVNIVTHRPRVGIQWLMRGETVESLVGRTIRLADLDGDPIAQFELADGLQLDASSFQPDVRITFEEAGDDFVVGSLEARGFRRFRDGVDLGPVSELTGRFRAPRR
jgi:hypothetical protein